MLLKDPDYLDGMGDSGMTRLKGLWRQLDLDPETRDKSYFAVYRVPLAASEDEERTLKGCYHAPLTWDQVREKYGPGRYEVVLIGPPPLPETTRWRKLARRIVFKRIPWLDATRREVPLGRASAAMFDTIDFGMIKPPVPKPLGSEEQPSLFNPQDVATPKYVKGSDTSYLAAEAIAPMVSKLQQMVLDVVLKEGTKGSTCDQVEVALDMPHQTASARINELIEADGERPQMLFDSGARRKTRHGQLATVWVHRYVLFG